MTFELDETPANVATVVVTRDDPYAWVVKCEGGCDRNVRTPKRVYLPDGTPVNVVEPPAARCVDCGPFDLTHAPTR